MSLEHYKTQVLLLHSQQSTLDTLSAGFNDRYSVHCATSGTEALNTLGDTPIHIFVSAQDLPGMSGLDAIREAKKRSPETIGILLAGTDTQDGLEAVVGDQEVFQIVRGTIEPPALLDLIESATKSVRLIALSESANDHKANVDEPVAEHIVMETSENGSAIVSDGTGQVPILRPNKVDLAPGVGGREVDVLVLTKDEEFLATIRDSARGLHNVYHAVTPTQAEDIVRDNKVGVLVTDAAMVGSNIESLTQRLRAERARIVAIVAGRRDDGELLMDLINRGHVYRFLLKPVSPGRARLAIEASVKHHMEAPDEAFKPKSQTAAVTSKPKPAPAPQAKPKPKPVAAKAPPPVIKPEVRKAPPVQAQPKPQPRPKPAQAPAPTPTQKIEPTISSVAMDTPVESSLDIDSAFGETSSFTDTMTDIAASVGKSISGARDSVAGSAMGMLDSVGDMSSTFKNSKMIAIGGGAVAAVAIVAWLVFSGNSTPEDVVTEQTVDTTPAPVRPEPVNESPVQQPVEPTDAATTSPAPTYAASLDQARAARDAGNLIAPAGNNAVELYVAALADAGDDAGVVAEFNAVVNQVLGLAENALLARNANDAEAALTMARLADPRNPRLTFLGAQLNELQLRDKSDQARVAIREARFEDAGALISEARSLGGTTEIDLLTQELQTARSQQRAGEVIALANTRLEAGSLISPANDNARYYFQQALVSDPTSQAAQQGLIAVASKLVLQARDAVDSGQLDDAQSLLENARSLDASSGDLAAATTALSDAREEIAESARQAEAARVAEVERQQEAARVAEAERVAELQRQQDAARAAEAERAAELERQQVAARQAELDRQAELRRQAEEKRQADARLEEQRVQDEINRVANLQREAEAAEEARISAEKLANEAATVSPLGVGAAAPVSRSRPAETAPVIARTPEPVAQASGSASTFRLPDTATTTTTTAVSEPEIRQPVNTQSAPVVQPPVQRNSPATANVVTNSRPAEPEMVPVSALTRTNYVGPEYPRAARRRNLTGSVDVQFTVTTDGRVRAMSILDSAPGDTFDQAAMDAVEQWRFEPVIENGVAVEKRTAVRLAFNLQ